MSVLNLEARLQITERARKLLQEECELLRKNKSDGGLLEERRSLIEAAELRKKCFNLKGENVILNRKYLQAKQLVSILKNENRMRHDRDQMINEDNASQSHRLLETTRSQLFEMRLQLEKCRESQQTRDLLLPKPLPPPTSCIPQAADLELSLKSNLLSLVHEQKAEINHLEKVLFFPAVPEYHR